uniref:Uncharacterized protein n=1 Tax=Panagrolaimus superbus TaxID=310955 RepID=A0A914Y6Y3_9BILA
MEVDIGLEFFQKLLKLCGVTAKLYYPWMRADKNRRNYVLKQVELDSSKIGSTVYVGTEAAENFFLKGVFEQDAEGNYYIQNCQSYTGGLNHGFAEFCHQWYIKSHIFIVYEDARHSLSEGFSNITDLRTPI